MIKVGNNAFEAVFCIVWSTLSLPFFQKLDSAIAKNRSSMQDAWFCGPAYSLISHVSTCLTAWFLRRFGLKTDTVDVLCPFWFRIKYGFRGRSERILRFNSKRVIREFEMGVFWRSNLTRNGNFWLCGSEHGYRF